METIQVYYFHHFIHSYRLFPILLVSLNYHVVNEVVKVGICRKGRKVRTLNIFCLPIDSSMISFEAPFIGLSLSYSQNCKVYHAQKMFTILLKMKLLDLIFKITNLLKRFSRYVTKWLHFFEGCIPVHLDFILPVHLDRHTSGSSRRSYLRFI